MTSGITLNGRAHDLDGDLTTLDEVVARSGGSGGVAVAMNGTVVPRSQWPRTRVEAGDVIEVVTAVQGG